MVLEQRIDTQRPPEIAEQVTELEVTAQSVAIVDQQTYDVAVEHAKGTVALRRRIEDHYRPLKEAAHVAHKRICDAEKEMLGPVTRAEAALKAKLSVWEIAQRRIREEAERESRKEAERLQAEQVEREIEQAEAKGAAPLEVQAIIEQPRVMAEPIVPTTYQKAEGVSVRTTYSARVVNMKALCAAIASGNQPVTLVAPNETALNGLARALKEAFSVPGVELVKTNTTSIRS